MALERKIKIIKRDTLADLDRRGITLPDYARQKLIDERRRLMQRAAEIKRELGATVYG